MKSREPSSETLRSSLCDLENSSLTSPFPESGRRSVEECEYMEELKIHFSSRNSTNRGLESEGSRTISRERRAGADELTTVYRKSRTLSRIFTVQLCSSMGCIHRQYDYYLLARLLPRFVSLRLKEVIFMSFLVRKIEDRTSNNRHYTTTTT